MDAIEKVSKGLLEAINNTEVAQLNAIDQNQRNYNAQVNNAANAAGLMFSTKPAYQQAQYVASDVVPEYAKVKQKTIDTTKTIRDNIKEAQEKIAKMNEATAELNSL